MLTVVECDDLFADGLGFLVAFAGDEDDVLGPCIGDGGGEMRA